ncbi:MAG: methylated-DNA--[protein]-cysteine S-methyltransferase [bacterium]|nr:MAG: methylated-DNA--[protein]-cysteine S-methyltransferase [bacterium]
MEAFYYKVFTSSFGMIGVVWGETETGTSVYRIFLPNTKRGLERHVKSAFPGTRHRTVPEVTRLGQQIQAMLAGEEIDFDLGILSLDRCPQFQQRVLLAEYGIPRGWVSTYGRIARYIGVAPAARAVGNALAANPFPIVIPCHRAVRSDGSLGGFRGGVAMKRALLELEGISFTSNGKIVMDKVHY